MKDGLLSFATAFAIAGFMNMLSLPVPVPNTIASMMGIIGLCAGFLVTEYLFK